MVIDLWIYCNPSGNILTTYYANQIRQGDSFMMRVCFPYDETTKDDYTNMVVKAFFTVPGGQIPVCNFLSWDGEVKEFPGMGPELRDVGNLVKGKQYVMYDIFVDGGAGVTSTYGRIPFYLTKASNDETKNIGTGTLTVQKTYGNSKATCITPTEYSDIIKNIEKHAIVAKQFMSVTDKVTMSDDDNKLVLKSWSGLGFINGIITFNVDIDGGNDEYIEIASVSSTVAKLKYPASVMGTIYKSGNGNEGNDVQFRLENSDDGGKIVLKVSAVSKISKGDAVAISGCIPYTGDALRFTEKDSDGDYVNADSVTISGAECDVKTCSTDEKPSCTYTLKKADDESIYLIKFNFRLPKGDTGKIGLSGLLYIPVILYFDTATFYVNIPIYPASLGAEKCAAIAAIIQEFNDDPKNELHEILMALEYYTTTDSSFTNGYLTLVGAQANGSAVPYIALSANADSPDLYVLYRPNSYLASAMNNPPTLNMLNSEKEKLIEYLKNIQS
jgi:hypothetical protein